MADDWGQKAEEMNDFRLKNTDNSESTFNAQLSAGSNPERLAKILAAYDLAMEILGWNKPLSKIIANYQASIDGKYHDDHVRISVAERVSVLLKRNIMARNKSGGEDFYA